MENKHPYKYHDFYRKKDGRYMIVAKDEGNPKGMFNVPATDYVTTRRDLLSKFNLEDQINIIGLATTEKPPTIVVKKTRHFRYFSLLAMIFGCALIASNIASSKLMVFFGVTLTGGTLPYLITYAISNIITEVYGFKRTRQLIWGAITCNLIAVLFITMAIKSTPSPLWAHQEEYAFVLGAVPRIITASLISYFSGEFLNSYVIAKLKIIHEGKKLWLRIILSSIIAMTIDNFLFLSIAYWGVMPFSEMLKFSSRSYYIGLIFEWITIPFIASITTKLKKIEYVDIFDINTNFTPFSLDVNYDDSENKSIS
jgi:queuosine precursor transporter